MAAATIKAKELIDEHYEDINDIHRRDPKQNIPSLNNTLVNVSFVRDDNKVVAYGTIKLFAEGILVIDKELRIREKAEVVKLSSDILLESARNADLERVYVHTTNAGYANILRRKYGFERVPGELLVSYKDRSKKNEEDK